MRWKPGTAEETEACGARLARWRPHSQPFSVLYLLGELGAGKTTLVRGFLRECGVTRPVRSPTYTLLEAYESGGMSLLHLDLYRLTDPAELENLGLREWARPGCLWLVEWPERGSGRLPPADLVLKLSTGPVSHGLEAWGESPLGHAWLARVASCRAEAGDCE